MHLRSSQFCSDRLSPHALLIECRGVSGMRMKSYPCNANHE